MYSNLNITIQNLISGKQIINELNTVNWQTEFSGKGAEEMWMSFKEKLFSLMVKYVPRRRSNKRKKKSVWISARTRAGSVPRLLLPVRFGSVFSSKTRFRFFSVSVLLTTKTPPDVESASPSVGLI